MLTSKDKARIVEIVTKETHEKPKNVRFENGFIRFETLVGEKVTKAACHALMREGLQNIVGDGVPEFYINGTDGARHAKVLWPFDPSRDTWNQ